MYKGPEESKLATTFEKLRKLYSALMVETKQDITVRKKGYMDGIEVLEGVKAVGEEARNSVDSPWGLLVAMANCFLL